MKVDIYKSVTSSNKYLSVQAGSDVSQLKVKDPDYAKLIRQTSDVEVTGDVHQPGYDSSVIIKDIKQHGYHLHHVKHVFS
ncbi:hypothetical protein LG201_03870 [Methylobacillus gramineus]|uniref:hypothetical protein n=1 Tax=Methylobacillus gramineus TaxID=755169 RepID=UPI001CFF5B8E|nr:hypothetical protein [Methylobacillus gramineus]MCB5184336.1 hypothetical protein [Methylobacillus gramineus]